MADSKKAVLSVSCDPHGHYFATTSEDRTIRIYLWADLHSNRKVFFLKLEGDHASKICFSPDGHYLLASLYDSRELLAYKIFRKKKEETGKIYELARTFPNKHQKGEITNVQMSNNSQHILTCGNDTIINIWTLKGEISATINTKQIKNHMACISPNSEFIAVASFMEGVKIWKLSRSKEGLFLGIDNHPFTQLIGHHGSVFFVAFTSDSRCVLTAGKDSTVKIWNIDVDYRREETPKVIATLQHPTQGLAYTRLALSSNDTTLAATFGGHLHFWDLKAKKLIEAIESAHLEPITDLCWAPNGQLITSSFDGQVRIWENPLTKK
uniref:Uncharacterized protein n=1 Tax=Arcella intermedia TaxID=1963864 RepID=A0A6B2L7X2_9EUKA